eukprot:15334888-Ditylum_brightwellii.AAC.1
MQDEVGLPVLPLDIQQMRNAHAVVVAHHLPPPLMNTYGKLVSHLDVEFVSAKKSTQTQKGMKN